jgi:hypothetical protein
MAKQPGLNNRNRDNARFFRLSARVALGLMCVLPALASVVFTCDPSVDGDNPAGTCNMLNTTIANLYNSSFTNVNANIYIESGTTGLSASQTALNQVSYNTYESALIATASGSVIDAAAIASLPATEPTGYGQIEITSALGSALGGAAALGLTHLNGLTAAGGNCSNPGSAGCYNGIITITTPSNLLSETGQTLYYRNGVQSANAYDYFTIVEHEADKILGTASCIDTSGSLADVCGGTNASAADLFRYAGPSTRVFVSTTPGAYFSYDSGATNVAVYNTLANGQGYADWVTSCEHVQDATGCPGMSFDITNDGGPELAVLDAVGFNLAQNPMPEPGTLTLLGVGLASLAVYRSRRALKPARVDTATLGG